MSDSVNGEVETHSNNDGITTSARPHTPYQLLSNDILTENPDHIIPGLMRDWDSLLFSGQLNQRNDGTDMLQDKYLLLDSSSTATASEVL
ncbi:Uncharacterized protein TCM_000666 [Theobroma cacao]|uniref:Uncharacterized protein n=1 Tax=Theobroma cacao TaxID=3641 RepID=A0A061DH43_THECC|nr:Uncharacterized protein TCM_000666 [Theobroma cacao]